MRRVTQIADEKALGIEGNSITNPDLEQCLKKTSLRPFGGGAHLFQKRHSLRRGYVAGGRLSAERIKTGKHQHIMIGGNVGKKAD
jgi:hypothetical protein